MAVVEGGNVLHHVKKRGNCPGGGIRPDHYIPIHYSRALVPIDWTGRMNRIDAWREIIQIIFHVSPDTAAD